MKQREKNSHFFDINHDAGIAAHLAYEQASILHMCEMGNLRGDEEFCEVRALGTVDVLQERAFELVEAGFSDEQSALMGLRHEILASQQAAFHHGYIELAADLGEREVQLVMRIQELERQAEFIVI